MPDTILESVLTGNLDSEVLIKWLNNEAIEDDCVLLCCKKNEFVACFLSYLRNQTDSILQTNSNAVQILQNSTPEKAHTRRKHHRSVSEPTSEDRDSLSVKTEKSSESPNRDRKRPGRRVKTTLFPDDRKESNLSVSSDESRLSNSMDRMVISSTPLKNGIKASDYSNLSASSPVTPRSFFKEGERCDTPRLSHRHSRSHEKSCLGDFLVTATKSSKKKSKKNVSSETEDKIDLDLSNSEMFPEIGARKSSCLRGEKKRIKPTNIDKSQKSLSLNSFTSECFQQPSPLLLEENSAFKHQKFQPKETTNSFEAERNILKQERHKLMEKFNILNTATPQKSSAVPQIKITQKDSIEIAQNYVQADVTKILLKDKIDLLINIYDNLLKNNLILSVVTEIYFLISIVISKQLEDDYINAESHLNDDNTDYLLKSIHNSSYFAVKSLWNLKTTLEVILEKSSLKTLGENKKIRTFYPDLAKFLLNRYCVRCEAGAGPLPPRGAAVVCYNMETDSADNFPNMQAFHSFKKQRDMYYEIVRWYQEAQSTGASKSTLRARIKALTSQACAPSNHAHLASLLTAHMLAECLPGNSQESKLSKLQRRLTCPTARDSHRLPHFTSNEMFYKEFIQQAENESFRAHLRDALSAEIVTLDATQFAVEDRGNSNIDISREYLQLAKKLGLLAKFLGYLTSLPYSPIQGEAVSKNNNVLLNKEQNYTMPKEKVLENSLALRSYSQPAIDIKSLLQNAIDNSRLSITIPWLVTYMSMLDYTTLHLPYYQNILKNLIQIYHTRLKDMKKNTVVYLKSVLGWFFDLPHFSEVEVSENMYGTDSVDQFDLIDESIFELCPCLRDVNTLLSTCRLSQEQKEMGSFRHITPVSINVDPQARIKNKEKELQARLEEEFLKSQPSSTRRVLEMVIDRVCAAAVRELTARELPQASARARARLVGLGPHRDHSTLQAAIHIYNVELSQLRTRALESARAPLAARTRAALTGLLPTQPSQLHSVAFRAAHKRISNWINDHWNTTAVLCKDIESELKTLQSLSEMRASVARTPTSTLTASSFLSEESPATVLIHLKEHICLLLDDEPSSSTDVYPTLTACACVCANSNAFCRAPTQRAIMQLTVDLCLVYVTKKPKELTESLLIKLHAIWNTCCPDRKHYTPDNEIFEKREHSPEPRNFTDDRLPTPISDDENNGNNDEKNDQIDQKRDKIVPNSIENDPISPNNKLSKTSTPLKRITPKHSPNKMHPTFINTHYDQSKIDQSLKSPDQTLKSPEQNLKSPDIKIEVIEESNEHLLEYFDRILCPRNILMLSASSCKQSDVWDALALLIVFLLKNDYLCEDSLTEQCLAVYRQDWQQNILESLSSCMKSVSSRWLRSSTGKFTLFLDFLAEYCVKCHARVSRSLIRIGCRHPKMRGPEVASSVVIGVEAGGPVVAAVPCAVLCVALRGLQAAIYVIADRVVDVNASSSSSERDFASSKKKSSGSDSVRTNIVRTPGPMIRNRNVIDGNEDTSGVKMAAKRHPENWEL